MALNFIESLLLSKGGELAVYINPLTVFRYSNQVILSQTYKHHQSIARLS